MKTGTSHLNSRKKGKVSQVNLPLFSGVPHGSVAATQYCVALLEWILESLIDNNEEIGRTFNFLWKNSPCSCDVLPMTTFQRSNLELQFFAEFLEWPQCIGIYTDPHGTETPQLRKLGKSDSETRKVRLGNSEKPISEFVFLSF